MGDQMIIGNISLSIRSTGEISVIAVGHDLGEKNCASIRDLLRVARLLIRIINERPQFCGSQYLWAVCEDHTFSVMKRLGIKTGAQVYYKGNVVSWEVRDEIDS